MSRKPLFFVVAVVMALALVAPVAATPTPYVSDSGVSQVEGTTVRIGTNAEYPPFEEINEDGEFAGFDIDLMEALAADAGFEIEWVNTRWDGIFFALSEGEFDAVISAATITTPRERIVDFTIPYFVASQSISVSLETAEEVATPEDLVGLRVGVQTGTTGDEYASSIEGVEVSRFDETTLAFDALANGDVDAVIADTPASEAIIANLPDAALTITGDPLTAEFYGIAVNPELPELRDALNTSIENVFADGTYSEIFEEYFGSPPPSFLLEGDFELDIFEVDTTDPESVAFYAMYAFLTLQDLDEFAAVTCDSFLESDQAPTEEDYAELEGFSLDVSELVFSAEETDDGVAVSAEGSILVDDGTDVFELSFADLYDGLAVEMETTEDGDYLFCPVVE